MRIYRIQSTVGRVSHKVQAKHDGGLSKRVVEVVETRWTSGVGSRIIGNLVAGDPDRKLEVSGMTFNFSYSISRASEMIYIHFTPEDTGTEKPRAGPRLTPPGRSWVYVPLTLF